jgi:hypothetical protein
MAIAGYYVIHEGAHLVMALYYGVFKKINFMGLGIQIDVFAERMTSGQLGIFCLAGVAATLVFGWVLIFLANHICQRKSKVFKAVMWYVTLAILLLDPLYLSVLCGFFGGGDMNGIRFLFPEIGARICFGAIGIVHGVIIWKYLLPEYTKAFREV